MRIAVLSDIHANLPALDAVLADAGPVDGIWHLGDVVGYGPDPNGVVARLRDVGAIGVRGNHDAAACGGPEIDWFNPDARPAMQWTRTVIDGPSAAYLILEPSSRSMTWHRVEYDIERVQSAMREAGLPGFLISRLSIGL